MPDLYWIIDSQLNAACDLEVMIDAIHHFRSYPNLYLQPSTLP